MNASIPAALLMLVLAGGWWLGRRRSRPFLRSTDTSAVAALNRTQIERLQASVPSPAGEPGVQESPPGFPVETASGMCATEARSSGPAQSSPEPAPGAILPALPVQPGERRRCLRQLQGWMVGSRGQRLQALAIASQSRGRDVLPLLRLGLRDPDPAVMAAAAAAMERFRGRSAADQKMPPRPSRARRPSVQPG